MEYVVEVEHVGLRLEEPWRNRIGLGRQEDALEGHVVGTRGLQRGEHMPVRLEVDCHILNAAKGPARFEPVVETVEWHSDVELPSRHHQLRLAAPHCCPDKRLEIVIGQAQEATVHELLGLFPIYAPCFVLLQLNPVHDALPRAQDAHDLDARVDMEVFRGMLALHEKLNACTERFDVVLAQQHEMGLDVILASLVGAHILLDFECGLTHLLPRGEYRHVLVIVSLQQFREILGRGHMRLLLPHP
mmetsp:Transcript_20058/g.60030  ORF Transcript_20058/g.60030 Transcript_20058/m.60030 type:complete len:245 (+) Transcript_20058:2581-3315(+)